MASNPLLDRNCALLDGTCKCRRDHIYEDCKYGDHPKLNTDDDLVGSCRALWLLAGGETEKWNGDGCKCEYMQGNYVCKRMKV